MKIPRVRVLEILPAVLAVRGAHGPLERALSLAVLSLSFAVGGCALVNAVSTPPNANLLGPGDVIEIRKYARRLDDFSCAHGVLVCEDRITNLRCACSAAERLELWQRHATGIR